MWNICGGYIYTWKYVSNTYENFVVTGDLNIDTLDDSMNTNSYLSDFCDTFSLENFILEKTCFKAVSRTSVVDMLTNRPKSFRKLPVLKLIVSLFHTHFARLPSKKIEYRNYKKVDSKSFFYELDQGGNV